MKRISCLLLSLLLALLCACGDTSAPAPSDQTEPDGNEAPAAVPEVCRLYYDYAGLRSLRLPTASCRWPPGHPTARRTTCPCGTTANTAS